MAGFTRRALLLGTGAAIGVAGTRYFTAQNPSLDGTRSLIPAGGENTLNDASLLSETPIHKHIILSEDPGEALVNAIRAELREAASEVSNR